MGTVLVYRIGAGPRHSVIFISDFLICEGVSAESRERVSLAVSAGIFAFTLLRTGSTAKRRCAVSGVHTHCVYSVDCTFER